MGIPCNPRLSKSPFWFFSWLVIPWARDSLARSVAARPRWSSLFLFRLPRQELERPTCRKSTVTLTQIAKVRWKGNAYIARVLGMGMSISHCNSGGKRTKNLSPQPPRDFPTARSRSGNPLSRQRCIMSPWHCLQLLCSVFGQLTDWSLFSYSNRRKLVEVCRCRQNFCSWSWCMTMILPSDLRKAWIEDCTSYTVVIP